MLGRGDSTVTFSAPDIPYTLDVPASWTARTHEAGASSVTVLSSSDLRALFADDPMGMKDAADGARRDPGAVVGLAIYHQPRLRAATPADRLRSAEALLPGREARLSGRAVEPVGDVEGQVMNGVLPLSPSFSLEVRVLALATDPEQVLVFFAPHSRFEESEETFNHVADSLRRSG